MIKRDELADPTSCINKAADDEPVFVLRASDALAPIVVRLWADLAALHGCGFEKFRSAQRLADQMTIYAKQKLSGGRFPT